MSEGPVPGPMLRKYRLLQEENEKLRKQVEELKGNRDLMSVADVADYLGFTQSAIHQILYKQRQGLWADHDRLPEPIAVFDTSTIRVWSRHDIEEYGAKFGTNRGYGPHSKEE